MRLVFTIIAFFILAQLLGMFTGIVIINDMPQNPYVSSLVVTGDSNNLFNAVFFIIYVLFGAVLMILLIRIFKLQMKLFRLMEFMLISVSSSIVFYSFFRFVFGYDMSMSLGMILGLVFAGMKILLPMLKNAAAVLATAGVGVIFGVSLGLYPTVLFLILLSIYDYLSVFMTKHMVELANFVVQKDLAFTVTAKGPPARLGEPEKRIDLGTGDMIAPIMLEVSAMAYNPAAVPFVFVGAVVSMSAFLLLVSKRKVVLPALPPVVAGMLVALLIGFLIGAY